MLNISGIHEGFVLDHIKAGMSLQIYHDLKLEEQEKMKKEVRYLEAKAKGKTAGQ